VNDEVIRPGEQTVGPSGPPIENVSGSVKLVGSTRHSQRGAGGKFKPRESRIVGPLNKPSGSGGYDAIVGYRPEGWIPNVRDNSQLHDLERGRAVDSGRLHYQVRNWGGNADLDRRSHTGSAEAHMMLNHVLDCPACATEGACDG
jgi:hypothetical protein